MPPNGETMPETKFWVELEAELLHIDSQLRGGEAGQFVCSQR